MIRMLTFGEASAAKAAAAVKLTEVIAAATSAARRIFSAPVMAAPLLCVTVGVPDESNLNRDFGSCRLEKKLVVAAT
jgi:hypothetical protein